MNKLDICHKSGSNDHKMILIFLYDSAVQSWPDITWQERLLHGFHQTLQVMFDIVHDNVDLVHIASNNYFLEYRMYIQGYI